MISYYLKYWGIKEAVFHRNLRASECYIPQRFQRMLDHLLVLSRQPGTIQILSGSGGLGKSSYLRWIYSQTPPAASECYLLALDRPATRPGWLIPGLAGFLAGQARKEETSRRQLARGLDQLREEGRGLLLVVDTAGHLKHPDCFTDLLHLHKAACISGTLLSVLLAGRETLAGMTQIPEALENKITMHWKIPPLNRLETEHYLKWYLFQSKIKKNPFAPASVDSLFRYSHGIPAVLNGLAENCLIEAALKKIRTIHPEVVESMYRLSGRETPPGAPADQENRPTAPLHKARGFPEKPTGQDLREKAPWERDQNQDSETPAEVGFSLFEEP